MSYTLNTSHALYANLIELIGVQGGALVSHKTARTFTKDALASYGSGTYGEHFATLGAGYGSNGAIFSPAVVIDTYANPNVTLVVVINSAQVAGGGGNRVLVGSLEPGTFSIGIITGDLPVALNAYNNSSGGVVGTAAISTTAAMLTVVRKNASSHDLYEGGALQGSGGTLGYSTTAATYDHIGGVNGQYSVTARIVWMAWFNKALTQAEVASLNSSLGAGNAFGLITSVVTPVAFTGTVTNKTATIGTAFTTNLASFFSGSSTPFTYSVQSGNLPAGLTLGGSTGIISGTPTTAVVASGLVIRATDSAAATANSNSFSITVSAVINTAPTFNGPSIAAQAGIVSTALTPLNVSTLFSDAESGLTFSAVGTWPAGVTVSSAGVISGTPTTAGTYASLQVKATDAGGLTVNSNAFTFTIATAALASTVMVTDVLKNNAGTVLASQSGIRVAVLTASSLVRVYEATGLTTNSSGILQAITDASITSGQSYHVAIKLADGSVGITQAIIAS